MTTVYRQRGTSFYLADDVNLALVKRLPPKNFIVQFNGMTEELYLEEVDSFDLPPKLYGNTARQATRIMSTFEARTSSTGVLLTGEKGSGKTLLAKQLAVSAAELGYPTIIINQEWKGDKFNKLIQDIDQPCVIFFDEFEKVYDREGQETLLTLLDGVFPSKKLFVLTCNDMYRVDQHMMNRPGRLFYAIEFRGLSVEFVQEYCMANLNNTDWTDQVCQVVTMFDQFNFDMLKALVEEVNRYNESPRDALEMLNVKPRSDSGGMWDVELSVAGVKVAVDTSEWHGNPLQTRGEMDIWTADDDKAAPKDASDDEVSRMFAALEQAAPADPDGDRCVSFKQTDLKRIDPTGGKLVYTNHDGATVTFTRRREAAYDFRSALY